MSKAPVQVTLRADSKALKAYRRELLEARRTAHRSARFGLRSARHEILKVANAHSSPYSQRVYTMRHLGEAVCVVRRRRLVSAALVERAGFNADFLDTGVSEANMATAAGFARRRNERLARA